MFKELVLAGLGFISMSREKAEEIAQELIRRGEISQEEGSDLVNSIINKTNEQKTKLIEKMEEETKQIINKMDLVSKKELQELYEKVEELEKKLEEKQ